MPTKISLPPGQHGTIPRAGITPDTIRIGLWEYHINEGKLLVNKGSDWILGYEAEAPETTISSFFGHIIDEDRARIMEAFSQLMAEPKEFYGEYRIRRTDGSIRWVRNVGGPIITNSGSPAIGGVAMDITDARNEREQINEMRQQWEFTSEELGLGYWRVNLETGEAIRNHAHARIFGHDPADTEPWSMERFLSHLLPDDRERVERLIRESIRSAAGYRFDCRIRRKDGEVRWVTVSARSITRNGQRSIVGVIQDITKIKRHEEKISELQERLTQSQKIEVLGQLAGGIAHDFNNLLTAIIGNAELALDDSPDSPASTQLQNIIEIANRSGSMVSELLTFARKRPHRKERLVLDAELAKTGQILTNMTRQGISIIHEHGSDGVCVDMDPASLTQILSNLILNAQDAMGDSGTITIRTALQNDRSQAVLTVADTGKGINAQHLPHIFEPFFTTKSTGKGTGLGLSTVYGLVSQNNGTITCRSQEGAGTTFELNFPAAAPATPLPVEANETHPASEEAEKRTILIVEDEHEIAQLIQLFLGREGFNVVVRESAEAALDEELPPAIDLTVTDIMLPGINGIEMSKRLALKHPETRFLFMSGYSTEILNQHNSLEEQDNFIPKPFRVKNFVSKVNQILAAPHPDHATT